MTRYDTTPGIRRKWTLVGVALALPVFVVIPSRLATALFLVDVLVFAVVYGFVVAWPCPRCQEPFFRGAIWTNPLASRCLHCRLTLEETAP